MMLPCVLLIISIGAAAQLLPRMSALVDVVRPLLPFPTANSDGDLPADNSPTARWFVVWPEGAEATRIIVRGNPLHPEVQKSSVAAMEEINAAVAAAERRAQASYDRALERLRKTGKGGELETISLEDEGVAGQRIDAELEVVIELAAAESFEIHSGQAPVVASGRGGVGWVVTVPANVYRSTTAEGQREHYRAAESHLYFGVSGRPTVDQVGDEPRFKVAISPSNTAFSVVMRGNASLVSTLVNEGDWARLVSR
jgi:hypothetical protein